MTFKVEQSGWYRTRDGRDAEVVVTPANEPYPVVGYIVGTNSRFSWTTEGLAHLSHPLQEKDLIEYLGKERPAKNKVVRMAPALILEDDGGYHAISREIYPSEKSARNDQGDFFIRWLIDTPYAIDVEVPDND